MGLFRRYSWGVGRVVNQEWVYNLMGTYRIHECSRRKVVLTLFRKRLYKPICALLRFMTVRIKYKITGKTSMFENFFLGKDRKAEREAMAKYINSMYNTSISDVTCDLLTETKNLCEKVQALEKELAALKKKG